MAEFRRAAHGPQFHHLLLRVAGYAPDDAIADARHALAEGRVDDVARAVGTIAAGPGPALTDEEFALLMAAAPESVTDLTTTGTDAGTWPEPAFEFQPVPPDGDVFAPGGAPPMLDLTDAPFEFVDAVTDDADLAAIEAMSRVPGPVALWRAWRFGGSPAARVFLLEADVSADDLPAVTALLQQELAEAGVAHPLAEVYAPGDELPPYQLRARGAGALLWKATDVAPVAVARVFDGVDPNTGPWFAAEHPRLTGDELERVAGFLDAGLAVLVTTQRMDDVLQPGQGQVVPMSYRTDGQWIWTDSVTYYLRKYGLAPDPELLAHMRGRRFQAGAVDAVAEHRALSSLFRPAQAAAPIWTA